MISEGHKSSVGKLVKNFNFNDFAVDLQDKRCTHTTIYQKHLEAIDPRRVSGLLISDQCCRLQADFDGQQQREQELMLFVPSKWTATLLDSEWQELIEDVQRRRLSSWR